MRFPSIIASTAVLITSSRHSVAFAPRLARFRSFASTTSTSSASPTAVVLSSSSSSSSTAAPAAAAESGTAVDYGGIPHVAVIVESAADALKYYTQVLGMDCDEAAAASLDVPGACVRVGEQTIHLLELPNPDPKDVDPTYSMSAPPKGYVAEGRPVHAGRDRHVAITLHDLSPLRESLEANGVNYTMSYSGRQALFCRDDYGNGWEFGPPLTYEKATRLFPPYLAPEFPADGAKKAADAPVINWGGIPHVGILVSDTPRAEAFYCGVLGMVDENDLRPVKLPFPGLFLRCGEQQVHVLELPNPDPDTVEARPGPGRDRRTGFSVKSLAPVEAALEAAGVPFTRGEVGAAGALSKQQAEAEEETKKAKCVYCYDPDANELVFVEDAGIQVIKEDMINNAPMVPWTRLW